MRMMRLLAGPTAVLALALLALSLLSGCSTTASTTTPTSASASAAPSGASRVPATGNAATAGSRPSTADALAPAAPLSSLPTVDVDQLPTQAVTTLRLIADGGPFPYPKDGATFGNREGLLPPKKSGFYREYTVVTPGSQDRGARRIVAGADGSRYWTDDHYNSFSEVIQP